MIANSREISSRISIFIVFSSFEKKYNRKSSKSAILENSFSKIFLFNVKFQDRKKFVNSSDFEKALKFKANLIAIVGNKLAFHIHVFFFIQFIKKMDSNLITLISLLNESRTTSWIDLKLSRRCLNKILKNNSNKNLYFKEEYEMLKAEYFFQLRLLSSSFHVLSKLFLFSKEKSEINSFVNSISKFVELLKILAYRLACFNLKKLKTKTLTKEVAFYSNIYSENLKSYNFECQEFFLEGIENFVNVQSNWVENRHYIKKNFRKNHFFRFHIYFKKIDLFGIFGKEKISYKSGPISKDLTGFVKDDIFWEKIIIREFDSNLDLMNYKIFLN